MQTSQQNNKRIAKNTLLLYLRTFITLLISLYSSRLVLIALGVEDFGIYNVVGGVVGMFALLSGSMTAATQRFIAYELGKKDGDSNRMFSATMTIHLFIVVVIIVLAETLGLWFVNEKLVITPERMEATNWVYQFSIFTFAVNIVSIPYNGLIIAHERMDAFAIISILEAFLKLGAIIFLSNSTYDRLIVYAMLMFVVALVIRFIYGVFCKKVFEDSKYKFFKDKQIYKTILSFTGWNFFGSSSGVLANQGLNILINLFFGVVPNSARGIASQVDNALQNFVSNFTMALNPQITKAYATNNMDYVTTLVNQGGKFCFFLFLIGAAPIIVCAPDILRLWLRIVPEYAVSFVRLSLIYILVQTWVQTLYILMLATGKIKKYQIIVGGTSLLSFPLTWLCYEIGCPVESCYYVLIGVGLVCLVLRLILLKDMAHLDPLCYFKSVIVPSLSVVVSFLIVSYLFSLCHFHWCILFFLSFLSVLIVIFCVGLNSADRQIVQKTAKSLRKKITHHDF